MVLRRTDSAQEGHVEGRGLVGTIGDRQMVVLGDLGGLFQPWRFYVSMSSLHFPSFFRR